MSAPSPVHILRQHNAQISALAFSSDNRLIYSGDSDGMVCIIYCRTLRPISLWHAHDGNILGVEEWDDKIITHGRDNKLHVWRAPTIIQTISDSTSTELEHPQLLYSLDVNALNYCRFSLLHGSPTDQSSRTTALVSLPNLIDSDLADVWELPSCERLHAAVGKASQAPATLDGTGRTKTGIIMSMHLFRAPAGLGSRSGQLRILAGYEDGSVMLHAYDGNASTSIDGQGWVDLWTCKIHRESVMHLAISPDLAFCLTVSADHLIGKIHLKDNISEERSMVHRTKHPGNAAVVIRSDGRVCAIAGWDGSVRLYSTKTFKSLGTLAYHRDSCYAVAFASLHPNKHEKTAVDEDEDEDEDEDAEKRTRWLIAGSKDTRISVWELMDFDRKRVRPV
ncbi:WD40 repeat-like protein [Dacryopinax primogenitus]|uniref:ASTRA-associated protein 1 n=1 Tax=Dacryopinax primogenitus (strain DJM 731) TaxID=1858805 RepID=M5G3V1_DACPD|nr:WD40 repeat-like protein [Dacryopinax primogenitus]EJU04926.1 WD40 repeat-like protein [Dacryopinax primogenitus]